MINDLRKKERDGGRRRRDTWTHDVTGVVCFRVDLLRELLHTFCIFGFF